MSTAKFVFTVDVEGAWQDLPQEQANFDPSPITAAIELLEAEINHLEFHFSKKIPVTWFFRCDDSVAHSMGCEEGLLIYFKDFIARRKQCGDIFGIHPHFYKLSNEMPLKWDIETSPEGQRALLLRAACAWQRYFGESPKLSRMGEALMSFAIAQTLDEIGIQVDSTALSGRERKGEGFFVNWLEAPNYPYKPSKKNYCHEALYGDSSFQFIEVPFSMLPLLASYDKEPLLRYLNLAYHPEIIHCGLSHLKDQQAIVSVVHPHEILSNREPSSLVAFQIETLKKNIENVLSEFNSLEFCTLFDNYFTQVFRHVVK